MRRSPQLALVAATLLHYPLGRTFFAHEVLAASGVPGGTLYPMLAKMVEEGWLLAATTYFEDGRPPLRHWELTRRGRRELERTVAVSPLQG